MNQNTLEQYAFAIGFDFDLYSDTPGESSAPTMMEAIGIAIQSAGLPALDSDRWDEFGQGRIFWGPKSECDAVQQVLSQFPVFLQEERNLDAGYYATASDTYYADVMGNLYRLRNPLESNEYQGVERDAVESVNSIPLDAYRLQSIDPNLQGIIERSLSDRSEPSPSPSPDPVSLTTETAVAEQAALEQEVSDLRSQLAQQSAQMQALETLKMTALTARATAEQEANDLKAQLAQQSNHIHELERQATVFEDQISFLQGTVADKVDPQRLDDLQAQFAHQTLHLQTLEARLAQAESHVKSWEMKAEQWIDPEEYAQVQQQLHSKATYIQDLEQRLQRQEQQLQDAVSVATRKIDSAKYQALEQALAEKTTQGEEMRRVMVQLQRDLGEWQTVAESKVEWSEYQALQQELQRLQSKQKRGFFARLFG